MHKREKYKMTPVEIRDALARGMNFDAVMARHASDIQRDQGIDMGLSMARARTDVQNIQNQRDEGIDPAPYASPVAPTIGAQDVALKPLEKALTYNLPTLARDAVLDPLAQQSAAARAALPDISGALGEKGFLGMGAGALTPSQQLQQANLQAQFLQDPSIQAAFQTQADMPSEIARFARAVQPSVPVDQVAKLQGMRPSALRDINLEAVTRDDALIKSIIESSPNEAARFARIAGGEAPLDANEEARFVRAAQSAAQQRGVNIAPSFDEGIGLGSPTRALGDPTAFADFSDFQGIATPSFAEQAAQPTAGIDPNELARFARAGQPMATGLSADQAANLAADEASLRQATRLAGLDPSEVGRFARAGQPPLSQVQDELDRFEREQARVERTAGTSFDPFELFPAGAPRENIWSQGLGGLGDFWQYAQTGGADQKEMAITEARQTFLNNNQGLATTNPEEFTKKLAEFERALSDYNTHKSNMSELERFKVKAQQTNAPADIAAVTAKEKEVKQSKAKADANTIISDAGGVTEMFDERMVDRVTPFSAQIQSDMTTPTPLPATPPAALPPALPPIGTGGIGGGAAAPTTGTYTGTGGLMGLTPSAQLTGLGELGGVLGGRAQYVQQALDPSQQLARYSSFLPTTALTPEMEDYMQRIALPQMEAAFYAQGGDLEGSPFAPTAGSPYSAFENFMRTGQRLDPTQFREYLGEVSGALQASDPTQRQQFLSSLYASPAEQQQLLYQQMAAGTSAATRGALGRMLGRQYQQQQFQDPASAFLPSALARGGIGGAFSQYVTPQGTVAAAGQPPAMSTIMANQGMPPAIPAIPATAGMSSGEMFGERMADRVTPFSAQIQADMAATPPVVPMAATPAIAPTPVVPQSVQSTMPKVNRPQGMSVAFGGQGGGLYDPTTYNMNPNEFASYLDTQREGLTPRYDITGTNIIGYDALGKGQAIRTEVDKQGNQQNMIVNDPDLISGTTKKKKKKKKNGKTVTPMATTMPSLVLQGEMP